MGQNIEEYKLKNKIRNSYLRHQGDVVAVAHEVGYDLKFIRKEVKKIHKSEDWKNQVIISRNMQDLMLGKYNMRFIRFKEMLDDLENKQRKIVSACCSKSINRVGSSPKFTCSSCGLECRTHEVEVLAIYNLKASILNDMAADDERMAAFMMKMGMTEHPEPPTPPSVKLTQFNVNLPGNKHHDPVVQEKLKKVQDLGPMERERLIRSLEDEIVKLTTEIDNDEGQTVPDGQVKEKKKDANVTDADFKAEKQT